MVYKAEALDKGLNLRFVVTSRDDPPEALYTWYTRRGDRPELCIKDLKGDRFADRSRCHRFRPTSSGCSSTRLLTDCSTPFDAGWPACMSPLQIGMLRLRFTEFGGWVRQRIDVVALHLASCHSGEPLWQLLANRPGRS